MFSQGNEPFAVYAHYKNFNYFFLYYQIYSWIDSLMFKITFEQMKFIPEAFLQESKGADSARDMERSYHQRMPRGHSTRQ